MGMSFWQLSAPEAKMKSPFRQRFNVTRVNIDHHLVITFLEIMMTLSGPLCGEFTGQRWIPLTKATDA